MNKSIGLIILIAFLLISNNVNSQKEIKYKDVYQYVLQKDTILTYELLKEYQEQDPFNANAYYQLGLISQYWSNKYDALTQAEDVNYFIYHTGVYLNLSKKYIDDKEIRKNGEFYQGIKATKDDKISFEDVIADIDSRLSKNADYNHNVSSIQNNYIKSVDFYNRCVELFLEINKNNSNQKEMLLSIDSTLLNKIGQLGRLYDSTIFYIENFEKGIQNYTIKSYKQKHKIKPIETYRLEGLTYSSFLKSEINLWNFRLWVDMFNKTLETDISDIRKKTDSTETVLINKIKMLSGKYAFSDSLIQTKVKPEILFKIGKYDYNSVVVDLLNYQEAVTNFFEYAQKTDNNIESENTLDLKKKATYYSELVYKKTYSDSLKIIVDNKINPRSVSKYNDFVNSNFGNIDGFKKYIITQNSNNSKSLNKYLDNLKYFMYKSFDENQKDTVVKFGKYEIPLTINLKTDLLGNALNTRSLSSDSKGNLYIGGSLKIANSENTFVALMAENKIKWFKTFSDKINSTESSVIVKANEDGCFAVFSFIENGNVSNKVVRFDLKGNKKIEKDLEYNSVARYLSYDDINDKILLAFYGNTINENSTNNFELELVRFSLGKNFELDWINPVKIKFTGNFVDLITINQNYYLFANFNEYTDLNNNTVNVIDKTSKSQNNTLLTIINEKAEKISMISFPSSKYYYLKKVVKINNDLINLMGVYGDLNNAKLDINKKGGEFFYKLINNKGDVIYE
ncbi:MAG: hypothetical protein JXR51_01290 [Bacteroidales bacterium]|nr:hypothetical protein [Bacteroidales bacterium]MBN2755778.1 hypothetical protein [Bacteroidales bacterium]